MAKNLSSGDKVFAVRSFAGANELYVGHVSYVHDDYCYVDWEMPHKVLGAHSKADNLYRSAKRAILAYIQLEQQRLLFQATALGVAEAEKEASKPKSTQDNAAIQKVRTDELKDVLSTWTSRGYKRHGKKFAYYALNPRGSEPRLLRAYKGRHGNIKLMGISESLAIAGKEFYRLNRIPDHIRDDDLWYFDIPYPWSQWIKPPKTGDVLIRSNRNGQQRSDTPGAC